MTRITIAPTPLERGLHQAGYDKLVEDLEAQGHDVILRAPIEQRGAAGDIFQGAYAVALKLYEDVEPHVLDALVAAIVARLFARRAPKRKRTAAIYDPHDEVLTEVDLPAGPPNDQ